MPGVTATSSPRLARAGLGALSGLLAAATALASAELAAGLADRPEAGPVAVVGASVIDLTPQAVKEWAVQTLGPENKTWLTRGVLALSALFAMGLGVLALSRRVLASAGVLVFGAIGVLAALDRPTGVAGDVVPPLVGAGLGGLVLYLLAGRLTAPPRAAEGGVGPAGLPGREQDFGGPGFDRRGFVIVASAAAAASAGAGALGQRLDSSSGAEATASRGAVRLPEPNSPAPPQPSGADLRLTGLTPFFTPNADFYRVDTALVVPRVDATRWSLRVHGEGVRKPLTLTFDDLLGRELVERDITLACVSNQVGGPYVGNARWIGVRLADILREAGVQAPSAGGPADQLVARSVDGMTIGTPVETVLDGRDALLALGMNGAPLPFRHGFPVRMVVPGLFGYVSACKWLRELELTTFADYDAYWVRRDWAAKAPVKTQSRIDTPKPLATVRRGRVPVAGVAWAQHRGIARVEVRVDEGAWQRAELAPAATEDTWRQWVWEWDATPGRHQVEVRATDGDGRTQTARRVGTIPDGATGRHTVVVNVD
ncbi:molybdopterin-dependent oxidoreductase [Streptomyces sp. JJ38]|uniref:molybdopterin-dependent oxidoreductase n=1 Tax=Streptomyces sp. JJ38 TaxID=2738128 RepID=UPI001C562D28|nr:molybdopterin-dependent oxidoreductase [Streptomyces sp. JJ38]MBW1596020.1 molybdopterin-dependent oxidoreductase [Streptomyces sp. JJ38]